MLQVLNRGIIKKTGSLPIGTLVKHNLLITADMVPSFRLIGYYHGKTGDIVADSVWVDVRDGCEIKVTVSKQSPVRQITNTTSPQFAFGDLFWLDYCYIICENND